MSPQCSDIFQARERSQGTIPWGLCNERCKNLPHQTRRTACCGEPLSIAEQLKVALFLKGGDLLKGFIILHF